jgi:hypothetical protein
MDGGPAAASSLVSLPGSCGAPRCSPLCAWGGLWLMLYASYAVAVSLYVSSLALD